ARAAIRACSRPRDLVVENGRSDDAVVEVREVEFLVRRVCVLVWQTDAEEHGRQPELLLERGHDRTRPAFAGIHRLSTEALLDGAARGLDEWIVVPSHPRLAAVHARNLHLD